MISRDEIRTQALSVLGSLIKSPAGQAMIFREAEEIRKKMGISEDDFRQGMERWAAAQGMVPA